jgi:hypothetical protein
MRDSSPNEAGGRLRKPLARPLFPAVVPQHGGPMAPRAAGATKMALDVPKIGSEPFDRSGGVLELPDRGIRFAKGAR